MVTAEEPPEETLREVKGLIDGLEETVEKRDNLYGLAAVLGRARALEELSFPDVSVACGPLQPYGRRRDTILNPVLAAEALSPSTGPDDRGDKWLSCQGIPTLHYYMLLATGQVRVELYTREETGWRFEVWEDPEAHVPLPSLGITVPLSDLYIQVDFEEPLPQAG